MPSEEGLLHAVVVVLIKRGFRYLMVRDDNRGGTWYPPAGTMGRGEDLLSAAERVVRRASGCAPVLDALVRVSHMPTMPGRATGQVRFVVDGRISSEALAENTAMAPASYLLPVEIAELPLRDPAVAELISGHARGMPRVSLDVYRVGLA